MPTPMSGKDLAEALSRFVNSMSNREEVAIFVDEVLHDHRTLQQQTFELFMCCIEGWAKAAEKGNFDGRNEYTVTLCQRMLAEATKPGVLPTWCGRVPLI